MRHTSATMERRKNNFLRHTVYQGKVIFLLLIVAEITCHPYCPKLLSSSLVSLWRQTWTTSRNNLFFQNRHRWENSNAFLCSEDTFTLKLCAMPCNVDDFLSSYNNVFLWNNHNCGNCLPLLLLKMRASNQLIIS